MKRNHSLDWARIIAAQTVCLGHLRNTFFPDFKSVPIHPPWFTALAFIGGLGHWAVIVFFVISGWQVGGQLVDRPFSFADFAGYTIDRLARFWCVLVPLIAGCWCLSAMGRIHVNPKSVSIIAAATNLFSLQSLWGLQFADNYPLWSLANEWCYYFCGPILVAAATSRRIDLLALGAAITAIYLQAIDLTFVTGGLLWLISAYFGKAELAHRRVFIAPTVFVAAVIVARVFRLESNAAADLVVGLLFLNCAIALRHSGTRFDRATRYQPYTFSLYVTHVPLIAVLTTAGVAVHVDLKGLTAVLVAFILANAVAFIFYWLFERHYKAVRFWMRSLLFPNKFDRNAVASSEARQ